MRINESLWMTESLDGCFDSKCEVVQSLGGFNKQREEKTPRLVCMNGLRSYAKNLDEID